MLLKVEAHKNFKYVSSVIRTEDIRKAHESPLNDAETTICFYMDIDDLTINENFDSFYERFYKLACEEEYTDNEDLELG